MGSVACPPTPLLRAALRLHLHPVTPLAAKVVALEPATTNVAREAEGLVQHEVRTCELTRQSGEKQQDAGTSRSVVAAQPIEEIPREENPRLGPHGEETDPSCQAPGVGETRDVTKEHPGVHKGFPEPGKAIPRVRLF